MHLVNTCIVSIIHLYNINLHVLKHYFMFLTMLTAKITMNNMYIKI